MTKETKIGLLVGLAFIIVFAVILSEKGSPARSDKPIFSTADGTSGHKSGDGSALTDGRLTVENRLGDIVKPDPNAAPPNAMPEEPIGSLSADSGEVELPKLPDSLQDILNMPIARGPTDEQAPPTGPSLHAPFGHAETTAPPANALADGSSRGQPPPAAQDGASRPPLTIPSGESLAMNRENASPGTTPNVNATPTPVAYTIKTTHTVQSGESIGKIAAKYYGRATPARIQALFDANREVLASVNQVRADTTLKIPLLSDTEAGFEPAPDFALSREFVDVPGRNPDAGIRIPPSMPEGASSAGNRRVADGSAGGRTASPRDAAARSTINADPPRRTPEAAQAAVRWYEVVDKDTLSKIARRELGDERRANDIWKLNRDRLTSKHKLKRGIKLRLPTDEPSSSMSISTATHVDASGSE